MCGALSEESVCRRLQLLLALASAVILGSESHEDVTVDTRESV
jgi:hypothetical protein